MRLFIAINFTSEFKETLINIINQVKPQVKKARYTLQENLHLTLVFIGESKDTATITQLMDEVQFDPFSLSLSDVGSFNRNGKAIFWVGLEENSILQNIAAELSSSLRAKGFSIENKKFVPHITLAREMLINFPPIVKCPKVSMQVDTISLMKSERIDNKLVYTEIFSKKNKLTKI